MVSPSFLRSMQAVTLTALSFSVVTGSLASSSGTHSVDLGHPQVRYDDRGDATTDWRTEQPSENRVARDEEASLVGDDNKLACGPCVAMLATFGEILAEWSAFCAEQGFATAVRTATTTAARSAAATLTRAAAVTAASPAVIRTAVMARAAVTKAQIVSARTRAWNQKQFVQFLKDLGYSLKTAKGDHFHIIDSITGKAVLTAAGKPVMIPENLLSDRPFIIRILNALGFPKQGETEWAVYKAIAKKMK